MDTALSKALETHPCYNHGAEKRCARMHLPVAPRCNIQCNYCNRKYDCSNESRPGVTSEVLTPAEAVEKIRAVKEKIPELKVIGIAGPGDPLANAETFETVDMVHREFPDLTLCLSTNGLMLPEYASSMYEKGVRFITVTMNAADPEISSKIYEFVRWGGKKLKGKEAAERLLTNQLDGIKKCIDLGMLVKINVVLIPGVNDSHILELVETMKKMGVYVVNILPLIPVEGTAFADMRAPTPEERKKIIDACPDDVRMMRHCRQCRADAIGLLENDRSKEFITAGACGSGCGPIKVITEARKDGIRIAVASSGDSVDGGFGNTGTFKMFTFTEEKITENDDVVIGTHGGVYGDDHVKNISDRITKLKDADIVIVKEIGARPMSDLERSGKYVHIAAGDVKKAVIDAVKAFRMSKL